MPVAPKPKPAPAKRFYTLPEAVRHLADRFDPPISEADLLHYALEGQLQLSVEFVNFGMACFGRLASDDGKGHRTIALDSERQEVIDGVWDLPMHGGEKLDVDRAYRRALSQDVVDTRTPKWGTFVNRPDGRWAILYTLVSTPEPGEAPEYVKATRLPAGSVFVIRAEALNAFASQSVQMKPLDPRKEATLLSMIAALAKHTKPSLDVTTTPPYTAAETLIGWLTAMGIEPRDAETYAKHLTEAKKLLEDR